MLTFIIPTIGRSSLAVALESLYHQTCGDWRAIVIFDGIACTIDKIGLDSRVEIMEVEKCGQHTNCAGFVRNAGIRKCATDWVAFLDDDDLVSPRYVETFYREIAEFPVDCVIFRMYSDKSFDISPPLTTDNFYQERVGISFALKRSIFPLEIQGGGLWFQPSDAEDFDLLNRIRDAGHYIMISPYIRYFVRIFNRDVMDEFTNDLISGNRVFIGTNSL